MDKTYAAKLIINNFGCLPTKAQIKKYVCENNVDISCSTNELEKTVQEVYLSGNYSLKKQIDINEVAEMYKTMPAYKIAKKLGVETKRIQNMLSKAKIRKNYQGITEEKLRELYPKYSLHAIASITGYSYSSVVKYVHMYNIKRPRKKEYIQMWENAMYGGKV